MGNAPPSTDIDDWEVIPHAPLARPKHAEGPRVSSSYSVIPRSTASSNVLLGHSSGFAPVRHSSAPTAVAAGPLARPEPSRDAPASVAPHPISPPLARPKVPKVIPRRPLSLQPVSPPTDLHLVEPPLDDHQAFSEKPLGRPSKSKVHGDPKAPVASTDTRGGQPSRCSLALSLWVRCQALFMPFSSLLQDLRNSDFVDEHCFHILDGFTSTTVIRYLQCIPQIYALADQIRLDLHSVTEVGLADLVTIGKESKIGFHMSIKAMRWASRIFTHLDL